MGPEINETILGHCSEHREPMLNKSPTTLAYLLSTTCRLNLSHELNNATGCATCVRVKFLASTLLGPMHHPLKTSIAPRGSLSPS